MKKHSIRIDLTVSTAIKEFADAEVDRLRKCVIPIVGGDEEQKPVLIGSAVLVMFREHPTIVTAQHVLEDNEAASLAFFASNGSARPFGGTFVVSAEDDLVARRLTVDETAALSHQTFLPQEMIGPTIPPGEPFYGSVVGYPSTAAKRKDRVTIATPMESWSSMAMANQDGTVSVAFDKKRGGEANEKHVRPRDPHGKSGGAIFGTSIAALPDIPRNPAKLVGISTLWKKSRIVGPDADKIISLLQEL